MRRLKSDQPADIRATARHLLEVRARLGKRAQELIAEAAPAIAASGTEREARQIVDRIMRTLVADLDREEAAFDVPALADDADQPEVH